ncbi:MAG: [protein-PII] uridylyltransferase [Nitrospirae bacterium]|nr:MAG: [protein-PII] uridylyltransferase [Nitrospirota bacterium]
MRGAGEGRWLLPEVGDLDAFAAVDWAAVAPRFERDRAAVLAQARALYGARREVIAEHHRRGALGAAVVAELTEAADRLIQGLFGFLAAAAGLAPGAELAVVAVGGYGRGELNPGSDLDLLFAAPRRFIAPMRQVVAELPTLLFDLGAQVGSAVRTFRDCVDQGLADLTVRTALLETRHLAGSGEVFEELRRLVRRKVTARRPRAYIEAKIAEQEQMLARQGGSLFVRGPQGGGGGGGLREIHLAGWVGKTRYRAEGLDDLMRLGSISREEREYLTEARSFLWRVRNDLHFRTGRKEDRLSFELQQEVARYFGYEEREGRPASVSFMHHYYCHARQVHFLAGVLLRRFAHDLGVRTRIHSHRGMRRVGDGFLLFRDRISVPLAAHGRFRERPERLLEVFELSVRHGVPLSPETRLKLQAELPFVPDEAVRCPANVAALRRLVEGGRPMGFWLRPMYETGLFRRLVPEFGAIEALCQPGPYHLYTVDEHTLRVVDELDGLRQRSEGQPEPFRRAFRDLARPHLVYLGALFHDLGKGFPGDHSAVGERLAASVMQRLGYPREEIEVVRRLVAHHLLFPHVSQRLEIHDHEVLGRFVEQVGDLETLDLLFVLAFADARATHPDMWSAWKEALLLELYALARRQLEDRKADALAELRAAKERTLRAEAAKRGLSPLLERYLPELADEEVLGKTVAQLLGDLQMVARLPEEPLQLRLVNPRGRPYSQLTVCTYDVDQPGLFSRITGVLVGHRLDIKAAQVRTHRGGVVLDTLQFTDREGRRLADERRRRALLEDLRAVLEGRKRAEALVARREVGSRRPRHARRLPAEVRVDNRISRRATVLLLNAEDRPGLLHDVVTALAELNLYIRGAKIDTQAERVVDSFFVTDIFGHKIREEGRLARIRRRLEAAADGDLRSGAARRGGGGGRRPPP